MEGIFSLIFFILTMAILGLSIYANIFLFIDNKKLKVKIIQAEMDSEIISQKLYNVVSETNVESSEGFLKFIKQSRDWAFQYIEETQSALSGFVETVGPILAYYDKYGRISESESMNKIFDAYQELIKVLPETENKQGENNE